MTNSQEQQPGPAPLARPLQRVPKNLLFQNGESIISETLTADQFLQKWSSATTHSAYTTMRTLHLFEDGDGQTPLSSVSLGADPLHDRLGSIGIFAYNHHVERMAESCSLIMAEQDAKSDEAPGADFDTNVRSVLCDRNRLAEIITPIIKKCIQRFVDVSSRAVTPTGAAAELIRDEKTGEQYGANVNAGELKITQIITWDRQTPSTCQFYTHVTELPSRPQGSVQVDVRCGSRADLGHAKDMIWVHRRRGLLDSKHKDSNEVVMCEDDGIVREGLSSNLFFVSQSASVVTATEGILEGTVMRMVLQVCQDLNIPVELRNPSISEIGEWREAFITSTSRLLLPTRRFVLGEDALAHLDQATLEKLSNRLEYMLQDSSKEAAFTLPSTEISEKIFASLRRKMREQTVKL